MGSVGKFNNISYSEYSEDDLKEAVKSWSGGGYFTIRQDQMNEKSNKYGDILEDYVSNKSDNRTLYRGINMSFEDVPVVGDVINQHGMSSWTEKQSVAESAADWATQISGAGISVIFIMENGTKMGADISEYKRGGRRVEPETLISKNSKQIVTKTEYSNDIWYITVKEQNKRGK